MGRTSVLTCLGVMLFGGVAVAQQAGPPNIAPRESPTQTQTGTTAPVPIPGVPGVAPTTQPMMSTPRPATSDTTPGNAPSAGTQGSGATSQSPAQTTPR